MFYSLVVFGIFPLQGRPSKKVVPWVPPERRISLLQVTLLDHASSGAVETGSLLGKRRIEVFGYRPAGECSCVSRVFMFITSFLKFLFYKCIFLSLLLDCTVSRFHFFFSRISCICIFLVGNIVGVCFFIFDSDFI